MLNHLDPASALALALLMVALLMVILFEATNGFHDAANAVATVIYTKSLAPGQAVVLSGVLNFLGVLIGGIAVAYALVELIPAEALSPPDGGPAVGMLVALFVAALIWNIGTWWFGLPNSSSHCLIGSLIGVAVGNAFARSRSLAEGVNWPQLWKVLEALAISPLLGFVLAGGLYLICRKTLHDKHLYEPVGDKPPIWWMRGILILTCSGVSFAHGTNDGQKSIGLIMLTIIGLFPATYALNPNAGGTMDRLPAILRQAEPLITRYGDDEKRTALDAAHAIERRAANGTSTGSVENGAGAAAAGAENGAAAGADGVEQPGATAGADNGAAAGARAGADGVEQPGAAAGGDTSRQAGAAANAGAGEDVGAGARANSKKTPPLQLGMNPEAKRRSNLRDEVYRVIAQLKHAENAAGISAGEKKRAQELGKQLGDYVEYAPTWVRMLSALCLGIGTMIGYRRIVTTLGERLGNVHLTPAQGASAEIVSALLIGTAGFTGLPVSTTHIVTSGIGGTMVSSGAGLRYGMISRIVTAWVLTLPVTILVAGGLYYLLESPRF